MYADGNILHKIEPQALRVKSSHLSKFIFNQSAIYFAILKHDSFANQIRCFNRML